MRDRNRALVAALSSSDGQSKTAQIQDIRKQIADTEGQLAATSAQLRTQFPDYATLTNPRPLKVEEAQKLLASDEAIVVFLMGSSSFDWRVVSWVG